MLLKDAVADQRSYAGASRPLLFTPVALFLLPLAACMMPRGGGWGQGSNGQAASVSPPCERACAHYLQCKSVEDAQAQSGCVSECTAKATDPAAVDRLAVSECSEIVAVFDAAAGGGQGFEGSVTGGGTAPASCPATGSGELASLLTRSPWCHFSYSGTSGGGTSAQERVVFDGSGHFSLTGGSESSYSGQTQNQYGESTGAWGTNGSSSAGQRGCWKAEAGVLFLSKDGQSWNQTQVNVSQNSNGYPIITANGKEYYTCN